MSVLWYVIREVCCRYCRELSDILSRQILSYINLENYSALPASQAFFLHAEASLYVRPLLNL